MGHNSVPLLPRLPGLHTQALRQTGAASMAIARAKDPPTDWKRSDNEQ